jgi:sugar lactone lactonase YvrE
MGSWRGVIHGVPDALDFDERPGNPNIDLVDRDAQYYGNFHGKTLATKMVLIHLQKIGKQTAKLKIPHPWPLSRLEKASMVCSLGGHGSNLRVVTATSRIEEHSFLSQEHVLFGEVILRVRQRKEVDG